MQFVRFTQRLFVQHWAWQLEGLPPPTVQRW